MSWIHKLYETYENCQSMIGKIEEDGKAPLLPICHTIQNAHIQIVIDSSGNFLRSSLIQRNQAPTIIPATEESAGRAGKKPEGHPLCDSLQFVAGDFIKYGGVVTSGYLRNPHEPYNKFVSNLEKWCKSEHKHEKVISILEYIKKKKVVADLVSANILHLKEGKLLIETKENLRKYYGSDNNIPPIFQIIPVDQTSKVIDQSGSFIRWCVEKEGEPQSEVWGDKTLWDSWVKHYATSDGVEGLCYVSGRIFRLATQHPKRIRKGNDNAKLISSNDTTGYTFRGRFRSSDEACGVGSEVTQKAHSALRWLISRQGYRNGDQAIVAWVTSGINIPDPLSDPLAIIGENELISDEDAPAVTAQELALKLRNKLAGYKADLGDTSGVVVMGLDSATPGRMAITYYRELTGSDFLGRINHWHETCAWMHDYRFVDDPTGKKKRINIRFVGAPAPKDIAEAAYGSRVDDKLKKSTVERILPCIIDGQKIPRDIVESVVHRASNRVGLEFWEWNKALSIACALYRKLNEKEGYDMALDETRNTRGYLYGRLLAVAEHMEDRALYVAGEKRDTTAAKMMQRFSERPFSTWKIIEEALTPYKTRLQTKRTGFLHEMKELLDDIHDLFQLGDYENDQRLSGEYLLGYHCQRRNLRSENDKNNEVQTETIE